MIKLHISNIDSFFETVNECNGSVNVIDANGNSTNIAHQIFEQRSDISSILLRDFFLYFNGAIPFIFRNL